MSVVIGDGEYALTAPYGKGISRWYVARSDIPGNNRLERNIGRSADEEAASGWRVSMTRTALVINADATAVGGGR